MTSLQTLLQQNQWNHVETLRINAREGKYVSASALNLSDLCQPLLSTLPEGMYEHQALALKHFQQGENVCLATHTASGKSLVFQLAALERLSESRRRRILVIYPLKALASEQEERWTQALQQTNSDLKVGRVDGSVSSKYRLEILRSCEVVLMTPDVLHAWLLSNLEETTVRKFLAHLDLLIIDEAHSYTGVFGSNSAFLFRRLEHTLRLLTNRPPQIIAASATLHNPQQHLSTLLGHDFTLIGPERDSSPRYENQIFLVEPPTGDPLVKLAELLQGIAHTTEFRFLAFLDSRKQTERLASYVRRHLEPQERMGEELSQNQILPYRSGYEEQDRQHIQRMLSRDGVRGVLSTSALEMGIDIPHLDLCILYGVPHSATSLFQRIGRVGRHTSGTTLLIHNRSSATSRVFSNPGCLFQMPLQESSLFLENRFLQYGHALCLARQGGEHQLICNRLGTRAAFETTVNFPVNFIDLCKQEERGEIPSDLQMMKDHLGTEPHRGFPLRNLGHQYQVELLGVHGTEHLGTLTESQLMREAYPGAVYYYQGRGYRVTSVSKGQRLVRVRKEKRYHTTPHLQPAHIQPNLRQRLQSWAWGDLVAVECPMQVREIVHGLSEQQGPNKINRAYPLEGDLHYSRSTFERNFGTTGVLFQHPSMQLVEVKVQQLSKLLLQAFLMVLPFDRQDLDATSCQPQFAQAPFRSDMRSVVIYDQSYGSLRLSGHLLSSSGLPLDAFERALEIAHLDSELAITEADYSALHEIIRCLRENQPQEVLPQQVEDDLEPERIRVIAPGSIGFDTQLQHLFQVQEVRFRPRRQEIMYRGVYLDIEKEAWVSLHDLQLCEGDANRYGWFDMDEGDVLAA